MDASWGQERRDMRRRTQQTIYGFAWVELLARSAPLKQGHFKKPIPFRLTAVLLPIFLLLTTFNGSAQFTFLNVGHVLTNATAYANDVALAGNYAYVSYEPYGLLIYNVSNPSKPFFVRGVNNGGSAEGLVVSGHYVYLANYTDGLRVYDISNPTNAVNISHINNGGLAWNVALASNVLYLANGSDGVRVYDVSNPTNITNIGHTNNGGTAYNIAVSGNRAFLASSDGLRTYDISAPTNVVNLGHTNDGIANGVAVSGNYAFVLHEATSGLVIYDVSDPANPRKIGQVAGAGTYPFFHGVVVSNAFVYTTLNHGLHIFDVSDPSNPVDVGHTNVSTSIYDPSSWTLSGNYSYVANQTDSLRIYSLAGPRLQFSPTTTNTLLVSWPSNSLPFSLLQNSNLTTGNWTPVSAPGIVTNGQNQVIVSPSANGQFYRLRLP